MQNTEHKQPDNQEANNLDVGFASNPAELTSSTTSWKDYLRVSTKLVILLVVGWLVVIVATNVVVERFISKPKLNQSVPASSGQLRAKLAADEERKANINSLANMLEKHYDSTGLYPSPAQINSAETRKADSALKTINRRTFMDPMGNTSQLSDKPSENVYFYQPTPNGCDNMKNRCTGYTIGATLESGELYKKQNYER